MSNLYKVIAGVHKGKIGHIAYSWAGESVSFRFGPENCWQGEVVMDRSCLEKF